MKSPLRELIAVKLGLDPAEWVREQQKIRRVSFEHLGAELYAAHGIFVPGNTLRRWAETTTEQETER